MVNDAWVGNWKKCLSYKYSLCTGTYMEYPKR